MRPVPISVGFSPTDLLHVPNGFERGVCVYAIICHYIPSYTIIYHFMPLYTIIYHYIPLYAIICHYIPLYTLIYHYMPLYTIICHYMPLYTIIYHYMPLYTIICHYIPLYAILLSYHGYNNGTSDVITMSGATKTLRPLELEALEAEPMQELSTSEFIPLVG